jgi:hypothetical protein
MNNIETNPTFNATQKYSILKMKISPFMYRAHIQNIAGVLYVGVGKTKQNFIHKKIMFF